MVKMTKCYENGFATACQWEFNILGRTFYTIEFDDSEYLDFYEDEEKWLEAFESGMSNDSRVESMPNVFKNEDTEGTFFVLCAIYEACGILRVAFEILDSVFDMDDEGYLIPNYEVCGVDQI